MSDIIGRIIKRSALLVKCEAGETHICEPTNGEIRRSQKISDTNRGPFIFGVCLVTESGQRAFVQAEGEDDEAFAARVAPSVDDIPRSMFGAITKRLGELLKPVDPEELAKN